jgi:hypothetical protein
MVEAAAAHRVSSGPQARRRFRYGRCRGDVAGAAKVFVDRAGSRFLDRERSQEGFGVEQGGRGGHRKPLGDGS